MRSTPLANTSMSVKLDAVTTDTTDADVRLSTWLSPVHLLISVILVVSIVFGLFWIANRQDTMARHNARQMVVSKVESIERRQREITADNSIWTEAFEAYAGGDVEWLYDNVGTAAMIGTVDLVAFLPSDGRTQIGWVEDTAPEGAGELLPAEVAEAMLALLAGSAPEEMPVESAYTSFDGDYWLLTISRVVHTDGVPAGVPDAAMPRQIRAVRANSLAVEVAEQFGFENVRLATGADTVSADDDSVLLELVGTDQHARSSGVRRRREPPS